VSQTGEHLIDEIRQSKQVTDVHGAKRELTSEISEEEGGYLEELIKEHNCVHTAEVGCAYGLSSLHICRALSEGSGKRHFIIDPFQRTCEGEPSAWGGIGLLNVERAGYKDLVEFIEKPAHIGLGLLEERNIKLDLIFIDGWHTFDHTLVEFFMADKILKQGGIIVFDDLGYPSIRKVIQYILSNRLEYSLLENQGTSPYDLNLRFFDKVFLKLIGNIGFLNGVRKLLQIGHLRKNSVDLSKTNFLAIQKTGEDTRQWDHFTDF
jgi:predicted O-methyltransferase YrrM